MNHEHPDVQAGFRKGRRIRDQIANIQWIIEKARKFQKKPSTFASLTALEPLTVWITINWKILRWEYDLNLPPEKPVCRSRSNNQNQTWNNGLVQN